MEALFDMHCHMLSGCDDGAENDEEMYQMLEASYADGVRGICFTPHFHFEFYGDNRERSAQAFERAQAYIAEHHPDMILYLGNELHYHQDAVEHLHQGECRTLGGGKYLLFDFSSHAQIRTVRTAADTVAARGYRPIIAHIEKCVCLGHSVKEVEALVAKGCIIQIDADSLFGDSGASARWRAKQMLKKDLVHIVASDAHNSSKRPSKLAAAYAVVAKKYGEAYATELFCINPRHVLENKPLCF